MCCVGTLHNLTFKDYSTSYALYLAGAYFFSPQLL
jgi:hypothetical protein